MLKRDRAGTPVPGEYQSGVPKAKTVYDPDVISTDIKTRQIGGDSNGIQF